MKRIVFFLASLFLAECSRRPIRDVLDDEYGELLGIPIEYFENIMNTFKSKDYVVSATSS